VGSKPSFRQPERSVDDQREQAGFVVRLADGYLKSKRLGHRRPAVA
jgi:hypothetical protein